jgi:anti-anti-sigma factor
MKFQDMLDGDIVVIAFSGKIMTCDAAAPLRDKIKDYLARDKKKFVFDMGEVPWMNSEGIGLLATSVATITGVGGKLVLADINEKIEKTLIITKCNTIIDYYKTRREAVEALVETQK